MGGSKRKILQVSVVTETYPPEINGVANTMHHLVEGLECRGHRIQLIRPRQKGERSASPENGQIETLVPGLPIPGYRGLRFGLPVYWRLRRLWREAPPDVLYIATQGPLGHAALTAARNVGIPALTGFHTQFHQYSSHYGLGLLKNRIVGSLRRFHNRSDATLVPTVELREELENHGFRNVHIMSRGVNTELFDPRRRSGSLRRSWGCTPAESVVLYVGRLAAEKNLELALQAFQGIASRNAKTRFVLVGDGPERERLLHTRPDLILPGAKIGADLAEHYASGDLFLFPSLTETFGNVVLEAMASGLPVIAFDYAAARACIRSRENGIKVPMGDGDAFVEAAVATIGDGVQRHAMGMEARATAKGMSWERVIEELEERLFEVIRLRGEYPTETAGSPCAS
jgi:glycosyltransferase involved in cell wall biosynthesis